MRLNSIRPARGSKTSRLRVGRGIGSGLGKTAGRGHKGQTSRSGYTQKIGFEGGQMPLQRRLPKRGFVSRRQGSSAEVRLHELAKLETEVIDLAALIKAKVISSNCKRAKVILSGKLEKAVVLKGIAATKGAAAAIAQAGGRIEN